MEQTRLNRMKKLKVRKDLLFSICHFMFHTTPQAIVENRVKTICVCFFSLKIELQKKRLEIENGLYVIHGPMPMEYFEQNKFRIGFYFSFSLSQ